MDLVKLIELAQKLNIFEKVRQKLTAQYDTALDQLIVVLEDIRGLYLKFNEEINKFAGIYFIPTENYLMGESVRILHSLTGGQVRLRFAEIGFHCSKIRAIYQQNLKRWFEQILKADEAALVEQIFDELQSADGVAEQGITELSSWLDIEAQEVLRLLNNNQVDEANKYVRQAMGNVTDFRDESNQAISSLYSLIAEFNKIAKRV